MSEQVSIFGLGYVGCVSAACLAKEGHSVVGVDVNPAKVGMVNEGTATILEPGIAELVSEMRGQGRLRATLDVAEAVSESRISLVCVGTPSRPNGSLDLGYVERVCAEIGRAMRAEARRHTVVIRSTVLPGSTSQTVIPALEAGSGKKAGLDFGVGVNPEFLREGSSLADYYDPPFTVVGSEDPETIELVRRVYASVRAPFHAVSTGVAEMLKYACNSYHGLKVSFANEVGAVCRALGIDSHEVMRLFAEDRKLNVSAAYLRPGFAFGGSCLPKDLRALAYRARQLDVATPLLAATLESNRNQIERAYDLIAADGRKRVGVLGLAFKAGTDDLRESPMVTLIERLLGRGFQVAIYDRHVQRARVIGTNREYIEREIPHVWELMRDSLDALVEWAEVLVIGAAWPEVRDLGSRLRKGQRVVDLVRALEPRVSDGSSYVGLGW